MSTAAMSADVSGAIASARAIYEEVGTLNKRWTDLKTADDARLAYKAALAAEDKELESLERDRAALETERRRRRLADSPVGRSMQTPPPASPSRVNRVSPAQRSEPAAVTDRPAPPTTADRRRLKKTLNRFQFTWEINPSVVAQINSIADNAERPIGEALALLDLRVFEMSIPGESDADRVARLREWRGALDAYADHVRAEIQRLENQYASVLAIWDRWRKARVDAAGLADWNLFVDAARAERRQRITALSKAIHETRKELGL